MDHAKKLYPRRCFPVLIEPVVLKFLQELGKIKSDDIGMVGRNVILHSLVMNTHYHLADLFIRRDIFYIKVAIAVVIILMRVFGVEIAFTHDGTFPGSFLFDSSIVGIFIRHSGSE